LERNAVEQDLHVLDTVDRDTRLADIALDARMVTVVAAMGGEVEGDGEALLAGGQIAAVEGVGRHGGREAGLMADRPRPAGIHGGARAAHEGFEVGQRMEVVDPFKVPGRVERLDVDPFGGLPDERLRRCLQLLLGKLFPILEGLLRHWLLLRLYSRAEIRRGLNSGRTGR